jgi:hypothetical protein
VKRFELADAVVAFISTKENGPGIRDRAYVATTRAFILPQARLGVFAAARCAHDWGADGTFYQT